MQKNVQIDFELFTDILTYFLKDNDEDELIELQNRIEGKLQNKVDKIVARILFSNYKKAPEGSAEREQYRKEYLDHIGIHKDFRTSVEWRPEEPPTDL